MLRVKLSIQIHSGAPYCGPHCHQTRVCLKRHMLAQADKPTGFVVDITAATSLDMDVVLANGGLDKLLTAVGKKIDATTYLLDANNEHTLDKLEKQAWYTKMKDAGNVYDDKARPSLIPSLCTRFRRAGIEWCRCQHADFMARPHKEPRHSGQAEP